MTIKTWKERMMDRMIMEPTDKEAGQSIQAEIDDLRAALDAWEKQEPEYYGLTNDHTWLSISKDAFDKLKAKYRMVRYASPKEAE
jgi:hypothetical protein